MNKFYYSEIPWDLLSKNISGNADTAEKESLKNWLDQSKENAKIYSELEIIWKKSFHAENNFEFDTQELDRRWKKLETEISDKRKTETLNFSPIKMMVAAAIVIGIIFSGYFLYSNFNSNSNIEWAELVNDNKELKTVQFPDGSTIILNKNSKISYPKEFKDRIVKLEGEALFKVNHQSDNKFIVEAGDSKIEVLGTVFNVKVSKNNSVSLMVESGKVKFSSNKEEMILTSGRGAYFDASKSKFTSKNDINAFAWRTKLLRFQNTAVSEVVETLKSIYGTEIIIQNPNILKCEFNGVFDNAMPEYILQALSFSIGAKLSFENNQYIFDGPGC